MTSKVYFIDFRTTQQVNMFQKLENLLNTAGLSNHIDKRDITAIKLHFGEYGNLAYIRPVYIRKIVDLVRMYGGEPFITDANTLYAGSRSDSVNHITTAIRNGFSYSVIDAPIIIADGIRGRSETEVTIDAKNCKKVFIAKEIMEADAVISVSHFKGHELSGFGGAIKNMGMGCASRRGKMDQHSTLSPKIVKKRCIGCEQCLEHCSQQAIQIVDNKATIDQKKCIGCGECILICAQEAITIRWNQEIPVFMEKMVEYTKGIIQVKGQKCFFINFINNVSPACDCYGYNDAPIIQDVGILASHDPVAIDQASVDLVNAQEGLHSSCLKSNHQKGGDKFKAMYPSINWEIQLDYAVKLGIGQRNYELLKI